MFVDEYAHPYPLELIPVIDLSGGKAVLARRGERDHYRPLQTPLCADGDALALGRELHRRFRPSRVYLADLDAIRGLGQQHALIESLLDTLPGSECWLDAGVSEEGDLRRLPQSAALRPVLGSETLRDMSLLSLPGALLSLDFHGDDLIADPALAKLEPDWPQDIILMTLARVGSGEGPDLARLRHWRHRLPDRHWYAAGGVRDAHDLADLDQAGASGVLLASALHQGDITARAFGEHS